MKTKNNTATLEQFKKKHYGNKGTAKRDKLELGYQQFKLGAMIHDARIEKGMSPTHAEPSWMSTDSPFGSSRWTSSGS